MTQDCVACHSGLTGEVMVRLGPVTLIECTTCASWTYLPRVAATEQALLHSSEEYFAHPYFQGRRCEAITDRRCRETFERIAKACDLESLRGEKVVDVGCDTGTFIASAAKQFGIRPVGLDVAELAVREACRLGVEAYHAGLAQAPSHLRDLPLITAVDLVEHVIDPDEFLDEIRRRLRPGGYFYLETPNIRSLVYRLGARLCRWTGGRPRAPFERLFPQQHVQYFTPEALLDLARRHGFEPAWVGLRTLPWRDLATSLFVRLGLVAVQGLDVLLKRQILTCAVLRKGAGQ